MSRGLPHHEVYVNVPGVEWMSDGVASTLVAGGITPVRVIAFEDVSSVTESVYTVYNGSKPATGAPALVRGAQEPLWRGNSNATREDVARQATAFCGQVVVSYMIRIALRQASAVLAMNAGRRT